MRVPFLAVAVTLGAVCTILAACSSDGEEVAATTAASSSTGQGGTGGAATVTSSTSSAGGMGGDNGMPSDMYPAPHPAPPKVVTSGGPVLKNPKVVPVFFGNDDPMMVTQMTDFYSKLGATDYWKQTTSEYGVGPATSLAPVQLTETVMGTITDMDIQTWLAGKLDGTHPEFPVPDADTVFALVYPPNLAISNGASGLSCQTFGGYHFNTMVMGQNVAYMVIPRCVNFDGFTGIDAVTAAASHELVEAATDPFPATLPAFQAVDDHDYYWLFGLGGGETGDMCAQDIDSFRKFPELAYVIQRSWSNKSAQAGHDPCVPALATPYFNSAPVLPDAITLNVGKIIKVGGVIIKEGDTQTIEVDLFSDAATAGPWTVKAEDFNHLMGGKADLAFAWDRTHGVNGEKLHLDITVTKASQYKAELFFLFSTLGTIQHTWIGFVGN